MSERDLLNDVPQPSSETNVPGRRWSPAWARLVGYALGIMLTVGLGLAGFWLVTLLRNNQTAANPNANVPVVPATSPTETPQPAFLQRPVVSDVGLADRTGIQIVYVAITAGGGLIDLRFRVVDPEKAAALHDPKTPPLIIDETTGLIVDQLFMGHSHTQGFETGQVYYLVFDNPGNLVQSGSTVSVLLGNAEVDHVLVK